jgi:hypothetical protein
MSSLVDPSREWRDHTGSSPKSDETCHSWLVGGFGWTNTWIVAPSRSSARRQGPPVQRFK